MPNSPDIVEQYAAALRAGGHWPRADRGLIEVTGADRADWLNNLVTKTVKTVSPGEGNYAFATDVKGRTIVDLNVLVLSDRLWLDVDRRWLPTAMQHFDRYIITEDAKLADVSDQWAALAVCSSKLRPLAERFGMGNLGAMAQLQHATGAIVGIDVRWIRHDLVGLPGAEIVAPADSIDRVASALEQAAGELGMARLDPDTVDILRIEAGIPVSVADIDSDVVPPETLQIERGISYHKGCYLGQEVIERMRSHGIIPRKLVGIRLEGDALPARDASVLVDEQPVGRVTSACRSEALGGVLALGYVKSARAAPDTAVVVQDGPRRAAGEIVALPVR